MIDNIVVDSTLSHDKTQRVVNIIKDIKGLQVGTTYTTARASFKLTKDNVLIVREHDIFK